MECLLQYLDDLDDMFGMFGLALERPRRAAVVVLAYLVAALGAGVGFWIAQQHVPMALAISSLLFVMLLYRAAATARTRAPQSA